ncbi:class II glutamine amidotransferase [Euzebya tangerina]|uniref:class II glutamine amidotransferase n=1 Tax=Euzebya tangerina TaxID=591198 RepID=UPI000E31E76C|nr:class II glutamine amidotransferase [Euzebya tangerina]
MCRIAAYVGPTRPLATLLYDQPHGLSEQAYMPQEMVGAHVNVDGTSIVWFDHRPDPTGAVDPRPLRYRTTAPPWADSQLLDLAPRLGGPVMLGAVRSATAGIGHGTTFVHPFVAGELAGTHNGWISGFRQHVARDLVAELSDEAFSTLDVIGDSAVLFLLAADAHRAGAGLVQAAEEATDRAAKIVRAAGQTARLTLALADHTGIAVVNAVVEEQANSLYVHRAEDHTYVASEPLDPRLSWRRVAAGEAVDVSRAEQEPNP